MSEEEVDELFKSTIDSNNNEIDYRGMFVGGVMGSGGRNGANLFAEFVKTIAEN